MNTPAIDDELVQEYLAECREHLATIETDLLKIEQQGVEIDEQLVNRVFRAAHSIKGGAGFFGLTKIQELAHKTENALDLIRSREMVPTPEIVSVLLLAFDKLRDLMSHYRESNQEDIWEFVTALTGLTRDSLPPDLKASLAQHMTLDVPDVNCHIEISYRRTAGQIAYCPANEKDRKPFMTSDFTNLFQCRLLRLGKAIFE